jgi:phage replication O-like protein O
MTDPEVSKHFIRYPVQIQEALHTTSLTAYESMIVHFIIRKTFGWNKISDRISQRQIAAATGIDRRSVRRCLQRLKERKIIHNKPHAKDGRNRTPTLAINANVNQWLKVGAVQRPGGVGAEMVQGGHDSTPISGHDLPPYNRNINTKQKKGGDPSLANGKSQEESPSQPSEEWRKEGKRQIANLRDSLR